MNIPGIPDSIEWAKVEEFLTGLGIDVRLVRRPKEGQAIGIGWDAITCDVDALRDGVRFVGDDGQVMTNHIVIPIIHPEEGP